MRSVIFKYFKGDFQCLGVMLAWHHVRTTVHLDSNTGSDITSWQEYFYFTQLPADVEYDTTEGNAMSMIFYNTTGRFGTHITPVTATQTDLF